MEPLFTKQFSFPFSKSIKAAFESFGIQMKIAIAVLIALFVGSCLFLLYGVSQSFMVSVPAHGGSLSEGVIGLPQYINPVLSVTGAGQDLTELIYSGLIKKTAGGGYAPDLAQSYTVSPDEKTYTFIIRDDAVFQDGEPVTADDVEFTIMRALDPDLKSPKRANWEGVTVQKINDKTIQMVLKQPYPFFLENATMGILPKHIWNDVSNDEFAFSNYNRNPIGSGPYKVEKINTNSGGIPLSYELSAFKNYPGGAPYISHIDVKFYANEDALVGAYENGDIDSMNSISPEEAAAKSAAGARIEHSVLPRVFGIFFNADKNPALAEKEVRQALNMAVDKDAIVQSVLHGYGEAIDGPLPSRFLLSATTTATTSATTAEANPAQAAIDLLEAKGWKKDTEGIYEKTIGKDSVPLSITLSTSDVPELKAVADMVKADWQAIGADVTVKVFETGDLNSNVIRTRNYEALLFGQVITRDTDLYAFWDSSERADPGLNIALYSNSAVDKLLEDARSLPEEDRAAKYEKAIAQIQSDVPAVFLYSPEFLYVLPKDLKGLTLPQIDDPKDRFIGIEKWYRETDSVWKIFN